MTYPENKFKKLYKSIYGNMLSAGLTRFVDYDRWFLDSSIEITKDDIISILYLMKKGMIPNHIWSAFEKYKKYFSKEEKQLIREAVRGCFNTVVGKNMEYKYVEMLSNPKRKSYILQFFGNYAKNDWNNLVLYLNYKCKTEVSSFKIEELKNIVLDMIEYCWIGVEYEYSE